MSPTLIPDAEDMRPHDVYRVFAADGSLLYVGCSREVTERMYHHRLYSPFGHLIDTYTRESFPTKPAARAAEVAAITAEHPLFNKQHRIATPPAPAREPTSAGDLYTVPDAAHQLSISERTMRALIADGDVETILLRRRRLVPEKALQDYIERLRRAS
jgi:excisionase family DNA binding protein